MTLLGLGLTLAAFPWPALSLLLAAAGLAGSAATLVLAHGFQRGDEVLGVLGAS
jgi:phage-related minor tail protein